MATSMVMIRYALLLAYWLSTSQNEIELWPIVDYLQCRW